MGCNPTIGFGIKRYEQYFDLSRRFIDYAPGGLARVVTGKENAGGLPPA